ncbi:hypothetical protein DOTSEDRAFT_22814 [Dothistroma septosporum NZE10]|uniref:Uncharacterized protein n=1 Tax=Dothistroma septosporum (strain NZE10 / CBS 128990) TaxID=675120 RepID=N1PTK1_DOTSN|nr:hypothetical protein DOTSEDRAFT_22814 [Dothistroma septosporum NZE10]
MSTDSLSAPLLVVPEAAMNTNMINKDNPFGDPPPPPNLDHEIKKKTKDELLEEKDEEIAALKEQLKVKDKQISYWYGRLLSLQKWAREALAKPGVIAYLDKLSVEVNREVDPEMYSER